MCHHLTVSFLWFTISSTAVGMLQFDVFNVKPRNILVHQPVCKLLPLTLDLPINNSHSIVCECPSIAFVWLQVYKISSSLLTLSGCKNRLCGNSIVMLLLLFFFYWCSINQPTHIHFHTYIVFWCYLLLFVYTHS